MSEYVLSIGGQEYRAEVRELTAERARILVDGIELSVDLVQLGRHKAAPVQPSRAAQAMSPSATPPTPTPKPARTGVKGSVPAPLPGRVIELRVREGDAVKAGQTVLVMEAMKMENAIPAPHDGTVKKLFVSPGDDVGEGEILAEVGRPEMTTL